MRTGTSHYRPEAFSPWGKQALRPRTETPTAQADLGGSICASVLPFTPAFDAWESVGRHLAGQPGLVSVADGYSNTERKIGNARKSFGEIQNV
jgi:hypothetical protein